MKTISQFSFLAFLCVLVLGASLPVCAEEGENDGGAKWSISLGPSYRGGMDLRISGSSWVQQQGVYAAQTFQQDPPGAGPENATADRQYADGAVMMDYGTHRDGLTWYWWDERADQYDPVSETITFFQTGGNMLTRDIGADLPLAEQRGLDGLGGTIKLTRQLHRGNGCRIHLGIGFSWLDIGGDASASTFADHYTASSYDIFDVYDASGALGVAPPGYGDGEPFDCPKGKAGPDYVIPNIPADRQRVVTGSSDFMSAQNDVRFDIDGYLFELRVGPRIDISLGKGVWLHVNPAISLNRLSMDVGRQEDLVASYPDGSSDVVGHWSNYGSESDWLFGIGVGANIGIPICERFSLTVGGRYDWMPDEQKVRIGPNTIESDLTGYTVEAGACASF